MITVQVHDGVAGGNTVCVGQPGDPGSNCCGGAGSSCATAAGLPSVVCTWEIDLATCPEAGTDSVCTDTQCAYLTEGCAVGVCADVGGCTTRPRAAGYECRAQNGICDVAGK